MGNTKSKQRLHAGHERLNENDQRYFAKVQARNSTTRSRRFRKPHPVLAMKSCVTALTTIEPPREDDDDESLASKSPKSQDAKPFVGPLLPKMKIADDVSTSSSFSRVKQTLSSISEDKTSPTSVALPSPRSHFPFNQNGRKTSLAKRRLERARANQIRPSDSFPTDLSVASSQSSSSHVIQDYYTEMMDEAHRESREAEAEGNRDASRTFDSILPNGMVWAEVTRGGRVTCVAFSRCEKTEQASEHPLLMAIGTDDGTVTVVEIMDVPSSPLHKQIEFGSNQSRKMGTMKEHPREGTVRSVDFSPDGQWLIVGGDDCMACLLRVNLSEFPGLGLALSSVEMVQEFEREDRVYCVQFSPDGSKLALGGYDGIVAITSMEPPEENKEEPSPPPARLPLVLQNELLRPGLILCLDWNPDGKLIAVGGSHKSCMLIDSESMKVIGEIQRTASVETVTWKPNGRHVAIGCSDGVVAVVNVESQTIAGEVVRGMPFLQDGKKKMTLSSDSCHVNALCWSPDGQFLAIAGSDNCCAIVETGTFVLLHEIRRSGIVTCIDWRERRLLTGDEGRYLAVGGDDRAVAIMKTGVIDEEESISVADSDHSGASSSYFSIGSGSSISQHEWVLREDSFRDIEEVESFSHATAFAASSTLDTTNSNTVVAAVSFSKHRKGDPSKYMVIAYSNGCVTIIDTNDLRHIAKQLTFCKTIKAIDFSRKSEVMALGAEDGSVIVISPEDDWSTKKELNVSPSSLTTLKFSRRNERLAVGSSDGILTLLDPNNHWEIAGEIESSESCISCMDWSSRNLAVGRLDGSITVHETSRVYANFFLPEAELTRGDEPIYSVAFGVGGQFLAVGDGNGKVGIYSAKGGWVLCHQLNTSSAPVLATKWSGDGRYLAFGGENHDVGARVVDTVLWSNVKEMHKLAPAERFSTLEWSNNDKWMVIVCSNGSLHIISTTDWKVRKSFPGLCIDRENEVDSTSSIEENGTAHSFADSKETETGLGKLRNSLTEYRQWRDLPEVNHFLLTSDLFLTAHQVTNPLPALRPLIKCVLMLTIHTKWVSTKNGDLIRRMSRIDDGEPVAALLWVLGLCTDVMKQAIRKTAHDSSYSPSFGLGPRDIRRIQAWNEQWLLVDPKAACVDVTLLRDADDTS